MEKETADPFARTRRSFGQKTEGKTSAKQPFPHHCGGAADKLVKTLPRAGRPGKE